jgi:hypothetical protein
MKLQGNFDAFLRDMVNLSQHRLDSLEDRADKIYKAIRSDDTVGEYVHDMTPQGSWAQRTIINPQGGRDFDADFTLHLADVPDWSPRDYLNYVRAALNAHHTYKGMTLTRKNRCVRVVYANDFHVDVVPSVERGGVHYIANYDTNEWERTNPAGFTTWMQIRDRDAHANLRKVIRLFKYVRDYRNSFNGVRSIILTTMLGEQVNADKEIFDAGYYKDLPTAFAHLVRDLDMYVWARPTKPSLIDPSGAGGTFDHRWTQETYANFRNRLHSIANTTAQAFESASHEESLELWQSLFGDKFKDPSPTSGRERFGKPDETGSGGYISGRAG